jgi:membrane protein insertase Oxa1/YidC/SpoIIIJ
VTGVQTCALPISSGLVFYWTVMNLASAFQQWMVLRQDSSAVVVA